MPNGLLVMRLYGSKQNIREPQGTMKHFVTLAEVEALPDIAYFDLDVTGLYAGLDVKSETIRYLTNNELVTNEITPTYEAKSMAIKYPVADISLDAIFGLNVIEKRYKWLDIKDYPIRPNGMPTGSLLAVNVTGVSVSDDGAGNKSLNINIKAR